MQEAGPSRPLEPALFALLLLLHLVPLVILPAFPSQDGASHVETAFNLRHYGDSEYPLLREYYVRSTEPEPNLLGHLILTALLYVASPVLAEKWMLTAYVVLFASAVRYALRSIDPRAAWLAVLGFPFIYSWPLHMGFFNFCWGLVLFFLLVGYWIRHRARLGTRQTIDLAALSILLWTAHVVPLVLALAVIGLWLLFERTGLARTAIGLAPAVVLLAVFVWRKQPVPAEAPAFREALLAWLRLDSLVSFRAEEAIVSTLIVVLFAVLVAIGLRGVRRPHPLLLAAAGFLALYFVAPRRLAGGAYLNERLALFPFLVLLLWLATRELSPMVQRAAQWAGAGLALAAWSLHMATYIPLRGQLAEFLSAAERLESQRTLLPLSFAPQGWGLSRLRPRTKVFLHTASYLAAERGVLNLANYEGNYVHFPLIFRGELNPFVHLGRDQGLEGDPPCADIDGYERQTGRTIDYVLLWGLRQHQREGEPCTVRLLSQLEAAYDLTFVSEPRRLVRLYARRRP